MSNDWASVNMKKQVERIVGREWGDNRQAGDGESVKAKQTE